jgi:NAD(P)-dependent dehydrogenase (short-subunit alcohol dehydrogenase family)
MELGLTGKVAVVTGGSGGIGRATARSAAREGTHGAHTSPCVRGGRTCCGPPRRMV